jgi:asparagine synthase (glutamine-hydrolysing)
MATGLFGAVASSIASRAESDIGLSATGPDGDLAAIGDVWAAITGHPLWSEPSLSVLAAQSGAAAALIEGWRRFGDDVLSRLRGPFSAVVLDRGARKAMVAIDRFGVEKLCWAAGQGGSFVFGSTTTSVARHPAVGATLDPQAIYNYFNFFTVPAPGTVFKEQQKLLPAQRALWSNGTARTSFYWHVPYSAEPGPARGDLREELQALLSQAVRRALAGSKGDKCGAFLSGGLDSSTVTGLLGDATGQPPKTFTIGFGASGYDEVEYARVAARHFRADPHEHYLTPAEAGGAMPTIAAFYDEPFGNASAVPVWRCAKLARDAGLDLLLAGDGGDEIFAGNSRYAEQAAYERRLRLAGVFPRGLIDGATEFLGGVRGVPVMQKASHYLRRMAMPLPERMLVGEHLAPGEAREIFDAGFLGQVDTGQPAALAREAYDRAAATSFLHRLLHHDLRFTLADNDLRKVGTMCRLAGISVRYPFLDEDLVEFSARIPADALMAGGKLRAFFKSAMSGVLPDAVLNKRKHGFGMPYDEWIRKEPAIREIVLDCAASFRSRGYCRSSYVDELLRFESGETWRKTARLWDVAMLELWLRHYGGTVSLPSTLAKFAFLS